MIKFIERFEREYRKFFWAIVFIIVLFLLFNNSSNSKIHHFSYNPNLSVIEKTTPNINKIRGGGKKNRNEQSFMPGYPTPNRNSDRLFNPKPKYPWGVDPYYTGGGDNSFIKPIPQQSNWRHDSDYWDLEEDEECLDSLNTETPGRLPVDFPYRYDENGKPTLLIPTWGDLRKKRFYNRVEYEQTVTHMHHAPDFGIKLPDTFDMATYRSFGGDRRAKIKYAEKHLPPELILQYQNEIGKSLTPIFNGSDKGIDFKQQQGFAGKYKIPTTLVISPAHFSTDPDRNQMLGSITEDGLHISSYPITSNKLNEFEEDGFWILQNRKIKFNKK